MSSIINLKKEILKVVLESDGDFEKMNIDNIVKLALDINIDSNDKKSVETSKESKDMYDFDNLKKINMNNLSVFEEESDIIFHRMRKANKLKEDNERREHIKNQLLKSKK